MSGQTARKSAFVLGIWNLEFGAFCLGSQFLKSRDALLVALALPPDKKPVLA
jgi:hypothetical protein